MPGDEESDNAAEEEAFQKQFEECCLEYGKAINEGRHQDAESLSMQMMQLAITRSMNEEPTQEDIWKRMAGECEERRNWAGAEEAMRNALELARQNEVREYPVKTHLDLAALYEMLGRPKDQLAQIDAAIEVSHDSEIISIRTMALEAKARALLDGDAAGAKSIVADALAPMPDDKLHELIKARVLVLLARCEAALGNLEAAEQILNQSRELVQAYSDNRFMGGLQGFFAQAAATSAAILSARGRKQEAAAAFAGTLARVRTISEQPHLQGVRSTYRLAQVLERYAKYLRSAEQHTEADAALAESQALLRDLQLPAT